ncbi:MAG: transposase, partial [Peptococcaceae bacterium]|nr:transposase [Peptococcaceae bacterium]
KENLAQKVYSQPGEGKGMTRKARLRFKRLDGKIGWHNGLKPFQQTQFYSVWHDLKLAAFAQ